MKALHQRLIGVGLLASLTLPVFAQMGMGTHPHEAHHGARMENMREFMREGHQKHLENLKTKLQLQADQENAWKAFAQVMQPPAQAVARPDRATMEKLSTPERIDRMLAVQAQHDAEVKKRAEATRTFYASLNTEQKKTFDAETLRFANSGHRHHH